MGARVTSLARSSSYDIIDVRVCRFMTASWVLQAPALSITLEHVSTDNI